MARVPRIDLPGIAQHIVQRGNDRQACFADDADYLHYSQWGPVNGDGGN